MFGQYLTLPLFLDNLNFICSRRKRYIVGNIEPLQLFHSEIKDGDQPGSKHFKVWWDKACKGLGVEGVGLHGVTRHSSTTALRDFFIPEQIRKSGTLHSTNKAFDRYLQISNEESINIYEHARLSENARKLKSN